MYTIWQRSFEISFLSLLQKESERQLKRHSTSSTTLTSSVRGGKKETGKVFLIPLDSTLSFFELPKSLFVSNMYKCVQNKSPVFKLPLEWFTHPLRNIQLY
jgi:hypothetical protein